MSVFNSIQVSVRRIDRVVTSIETLCRKGVSLTSYCKLESKLVICTSSEFSNHYNYVPVTIVMFLSIPYLMYMYMIDPDPSIGRNTSCALVTRPV